MVEPQDTQQLQRAKEVSATNTFWNELDMMWNKVGEFEPSNLMWFDDSRFTEPHKWYQRHVHPFTKVLGKMGCRITSKVAGQGQAERDWGFTKDIRSGKRLKFSSRNLMDQVTCYGAYSVERANARNKEKESLNLTCTDEDYKSLGLGKFLVDLGSVTGKTPTQRTFRAFIEDWEEDALIDKTLDHQIMLRRKYGGVFSMMLTKALLQTPLTRTSCNTPGGRRILEPMS